MGEPTPAPPWMPDAPLAVPEAGERETSTPAASRPRCWVARGGARAHPRGDLVLDHRGRRTAGWALVKLRHGRHHRHRHPRRHSPDHPSRPRGGETDAVHPAHGDGRLRERPCHPHLPGAIPHLVGVPMLVYPLVALGLARSWSSYPAKRASSPPHSSPSSPSPPASGSPAGTSPTSPTRTNCPARCPSCSSPRRLSRSRPSGSSAPSPSAWPWSACSNRS